MKKRTKFTLRTKIYVALVGLLALAGLLYADEGHPSTFSTSGQNNIQPAAIAADATHVFVSQYHDNDIKLDDCNGNGTFYGTLPAPVPPKLTEKYMAIAPAASTAAGFTPGDLFVTLVDGVYRNRPSVDQNFTLFATWAGVEGGCPFSDHSAIGFDKVGTFGNRMIITCENGRIFSVDGTGGNAPPHVTHLVDTTAPGHVTNLEGPAVLPLSFGPLGGQIMVADDIYGNVYTIKNNGGGSYTVNYNPLGFPDGALDGAEQILIVPGVDQCAFCPEQRFFFTVATGPEVIISYPKSDFTTFAGDVLLTTEHAPPWGTARIHFDTGTQSYQYSVFDSSAVIKEGSNFVEGVCTPTPTPSPSPTPTATATPTSCALGPCTPPYPFVSGNPRTNIAFNESEVLRAFRLTGVTENCIPQTLQLFYNDEHALTLGVRRVETVTCLGTTAMDYPVSPNGPPTPNFKLSPMTGATEAEGGVDTSGRPMFPAMFITDITADPNSLAGDWQFGGTGRPPDAVFGTWKAAVRTIDQTTGTVTVTPDADPAPNNWNLDGGGPDPVPTPTPTNQGYGAECRWDMTNPSLGFIQGHTYRLYFMVHDGDQNKTGGDAGQACVTFTYNGPTQPGGPTPTPTPTPAPGTLIAGGQTFSGKTVKVSFQNNTGTSQILDGLGSNGGTVVTWPQSPNGNLQSVKMGGTTIYNTSTANPPGLNTNSLLGTAQQRTIAPGSCATLTFTFHNNVSTTASQYHGSAHFNSAGNVTMFP